mgnify:CR=1 FL=1
MASPPGDGRAAAGPGQIGSAGSRERASTAAQARSVPPRNLSSGNSIGCEENLERIDVDPGAREHVN